MYYDNENDKGSANWEYYCMTSHVSENLLLIANCIKLYSENERLHFKMLFSLKCITYISSEFHLMHQI